jgi:hypothetical protein
MRSHGPSATRGKGKSDVEGKSKTRGRRLSPIVQRDSFFFSAEPIAVVGFGYEIN